MRLAVFEGDVCASIEKDLAAHNIQAARRFPGMMRIPRGKKETDQERRCFCCLYVSTGSHEEWGEEGGMWAQVCEDHEEGLEKNDGTRRGGR